MKKTKKGAPACRSLQHAEVRKLAKWFRSNGRHVERNVALVLLAYRTGFRAEEALSLDVEDVFQGGRLAEEATVTRANTKGQVESRTVPLVAADVRRALSALLLTLDRTDGAAPLFQSQKGGRLTYTAWWKLLKAAVRGCGLQGQVATHSFRHTFADEVHEECLEALQAGEIGSLDPLLITQAALGHKDIKSTIKYLRFHKEQVGSVLARVASRGSRQKARK